MSNQKSDNLNDFAENVRSGLSAAPKFLSSKYFYDDTGSEIFRRIMKLPEYYLTKAETEIFQSYHNEIVETLLLHHQSLDLIELGAGDGTKTAILIDCLLKKRVEFNYLPIDISAESLETLTAKYRKQFPTLSIKPINAEYFFALENLKTESAKSKVILFLGSNIGNFNLAESIDFLKRLKSTINKNDLLLVGFDLQKDPKIVLRAYDDSQGVTADFNLNLLNRINRELSADFDTEKFMHYATYSPADGAARSFLISRESQNVSIEFLNQKFEFKKWEPVFVEISQKYTPEMIDHIAAQSGYEIIRNLYDDRAYFTSSIWRNL